MIDDIRPGGLPPVQGDDEANGSLPAVGEQPTSAQHPAVQAELAKTAAEGVSQPQNSQMVVGGKRSWKKPLLLVLLIALLVGGGYYWHSVRTAKPVASTASKQNTKKTAISSTTTGLQLDTAKNYGNKYANGMLPVGDGKYKTTEVQQGYVYACSGYAQNLASNSGGANTKGPWFSSDGKTYDVNKKTHIAGSVNWPTSFSNTISGSTRTIVTNDLPNHTTGVFPIASSDPAYAYDRNPNKISAQSFTYTLPVTPTYGSPQCMGGQVGVMLTGVALFSGFDAGGRDAGAWEVQDSCSGHPEKSGTYHYHTLSNCIKDISVHTVIGFALDGFPITGPRLGPDNILTTSDLDECHGITSSITLDHRVVTLYHYVMTQDFPYSVSCFRAKPISPPGLMSSTQSGTPQGQQLPPPSRQ